MLILAFLFESIKKVVNIEIKWKYWKSIAENDFTFQRYVWLYCETFRLGCGGGTKVSQHPVDVETRVDLTTSKFDKGR